LQRELSQLRWKKVFASAAAIVRDFPVSRPSEVLGFIQRASRGNKKSKKQYGVFAENPFHPSPHLKPVGDFWSVRVTDASGAAVWNANDFVWFWIGPHDKYKVQIRK
jgi:hypothetical protein